ncbi:MAG: cytochrome P450, partial [Verrucomicrobiales bacterium]
MNSKICLKIMPSQVDRETIQISREELDQWKKTVQTAHTKPRGKSYRETPGPRGWPIIGNMLEIKRRRLHLIFQDWADKFGPLYQFSIGRRRFFAVADADLIQDILRRRPDTFRRISAIEGIFSELGVRGLFSSEGPRWRRQRALTMPAFNSSHLQQFMPMMATITKRLQRRWEKAADEKVDVEAQKDLMRYTVDVTTTLAIGHDMNTLETEGDIIQRHLEHLMPAISRRVTAPFPYWRYITIPKDREAGKALAALKKDLEDLVVNAKARMKENPILFEKPTNFLEGLLAGSKEMGGEFTDPELYGNILTILVAGEDTTANSIAWAIYYLLEHPEVQEKMHQEAMQSPTFHPDAYPYLEAVANEAMRLKPVGTFLFLEPIEDTTIGEYHVPKGTGVTAILSYPPLQDFNFTRPLEFIPERWLPENRTQFPNHN